MLQAGLYIQLSEGQENEADELHSGGHDGPAFGPLQFVEVAKGDVIYLGLESDHYELSITRKGSVYYDGLFYGAFSVFFEQQNEVGLARHQPFDQMKAILLDDLARTHESEIEVPSGQS